MTKDVILGQPKTKHCTYHTKELKVQKARGKVDGGVLHDSSNIINPFPQT
jgi:hypothetical protein